MKSSLLVTTPYIGEFGFRLLGWQARLRRLSREYKKIIVCDRPEYDYLYQDFASASIHHDFYGIEFVWVNFDAETFNGANELEKQLRRQYKGADFYKPRHMPWYDEQDWHRFGDPSAVAKPFDLLVHCRSREWDPTKNMSHAWWDAFIQKLYTLRKTFGGRPRIGAIGSKRYDYCPKGALDLRGMPLEELCNNLAAAHTVLGTPSGPMHLAGLCGAARLLWSNRIVYGILGGVDQDVFMRFWNPHVTPSLVLDFRRESRLFSIDDVWRGVTALMDDKTRHDLKYICGTPWYHTGG